jgi:tetratricopeptide (TPR) repeat protein
VSAGLRHAWACAAGLVLTLTTATAAIADTPPGVWDLAADPAEGARWALHLRVQRMLQRSPMASFPDTELKLEAARAMLEEAGAAKSPDPRLRFDLGVVYGLLELHPRVVEVLLPALDMAPDAPGATRALEALAYAYAKMNRPRDELAAWRRYIPRLRDDVARATELMNMGEAEMRLGYVDDALGTFREVLDLCADLPNTDGVNSTIVLTQWDLAVALDRSGDPRGALDVASKAMAWTGARTSTAGRKPYTGWDAINDTSKVFFVPEWERHWYLALGCAAKARETLEPAESARLWALAERHREAYVGRSTASGAADPWLAIARRRLEEVHSDRAAAARRAARSSPGGREGSLRLTEPLPTWD